MAVERTLSIIKPDATRRNLTGKIIAKFEEAGLRVIASRRIKLSQADAAACGQVGGSAFQDLASRDSDRDVVNCQHLWGLITVLALSSSPLHKAAPF